jgi:predicted HicB family RNase H-like nuclease
LEQAAANARAAIEAYIESLVARGLPIPTPLAQKRFSGKIALTVDPLLYRNLAIRPRSTGQSLNRYIETSLRASD